MSKMIECICCQCAEYPGQFKNYYQCDRCRMYGNEDEFPEGETCATCLEESQPEDAK